MITITLPKVSSAVQHKHYCKESMLHPAKMPPVLAQWIIKKYTKEGELVLDPMCGIGTTLMEAILLGRNAIGVEYEQKFTELTQRNLDGLKVFHPKARAVVLQGDSRNLAKILKEKADCIAFSPPYAQTNLKSGVDLKGRIYGRVVLDKRPFTKEDFKNVLLHEGADFERGTTYSKDAANIANLPYGSIDAIITSPPYSDMVNPSQEGNPDKKLAKFLEKGKPPKELRMQKGSNAYSFDKKNIGNLHYGKIDAIITSPPYADTFNEKKHTNSGISKRDKNMESFVGGYGKGKGNIGNLKHGNIDAIVTSPPFEATLAGSAKDDTVKFRHGSAGKDYTENKSDEKQLGNLSGQNYLTEMLKIYSECFKVLRTNGLMILHTKNFVRNGKPVRLDEDTRKLCEFAGFQKTEHVKIKLPGYSFWINNARKSFYRKNPERVSGDPHAYCEDLQVFRKVG